MACLVCQCTWEDGECIHVSGRGTDQDPYEFELALDDNENNMLRCGPAGMGVFLPHEVGDRPAVHVYSNIYQTIANDAAQILFFNNERYDTDSMHDKLEANIMSRLTCNTAGVYLFTLNCTWENVVDDEFGDRAAFLRKNGTEIVGFDSRPHGGEEDLHHGHSVTATVELVPGDYMEALVKQDCGKAIRIDVERYSPIFCGVFLRGPT